MTSTEKTRARKQARAAKAIRELEAAKARTPRAPLWPYDLLSFSGPPTTTSKTKATAKTAPEGGVR